jgi:LacI family transcriptional regulator
MANRVTIQDIADELGLSRNTVSKALNNAGGLADSTRERIIQTAMQMGYKIIFVSDANAALTDYEHNATLTSMAALFADVMDTSHLLNLIASSETPAIALAS